MSKLWTDFTPLSDNEFAHFQTISTAERTRQLARVPGASQAALTAIDVAYFKAVIASARANNTWAGYEPALTALHGLTGGGV